MILLLEWREEAFNTDISPIEDIVDDAEEEEKEIYENYEKTLMLPTSLPIQATKEEGMKILPLKVTTARLQTLLEQVEAGNTSEDLLVEIREIFNSLYQAKQILKKVNNNLVKSIQGWVRYSWIQRTARSLMHIY